MTDITMTFKQPGEEPDGPQDVFFVARAFRGAGDRAHQSIEIEPGTWQSFTVPAVVNWCLAIELGCKALIANTGAAIPRQHNLASLLELVPGPDREAIEEAYSSRVEAPALKELLNDVGEFFVQIRYDYESPSRNYHDAVLPILAGAVIARCEDTSWAPGPLHFEEKRQRGRTR